MSPRGRRKAPPPARAESRARQFRAFVGDYLEQLLAAHARRPAAHRCEFCAGPTAIPPTPGAVPPFPPFCGACVGRATDHLVAAFARVSEREAPAAHDDAAAAAMSN